MGSGVRLEPTWLLEPVLLFLHARPPTAAPAVAGCHLGQVGFVPGDNLLGGLPPYRPFLYFFLPFLLSSFNYFLMFSICAEKLGSNGDAHSPVQFLRPLPILNTPGSYPGAIPDRRTRTPPCEARAGAPEEPP
jgi:hypothetical protein